MIISTMSDPAGLSVEEVVGEVFGLTPAAANAVTHGTAVRAVKT